MFKGKRAKIRELFEGLHYLNILQHSLLLYKNKPFTNNFMRRHFLEACKHLGMQYLNRWRTPEATLPQIRGQKDLNSRAA